MGRLLSFRHWIRPLSLGLNSLCYCPHIVGDSGQGAGEQEARASFSSPVTHQAAVGEGGSSLLLPGVLGRRCLWEGLMKGVIPLPSL